MIESDAASASPPTLRSLPWFLNGLANLAVVTVLSLASWYLLIDPRWSPFGLYPQPFLAVVFWSLLAVDPLAELLRQQAGRPRPAPRYLARLAVTLALGIATFALYFRVLAGSLLHEPAPEPPPPAERAAVKS